MKFGQSDIVLIFGGDKQPCPFKFDLKYLQIKELTKYSQINDNYIPDIFYQPPKMVFDQLVLNGMNNLQFISLTNKPGGKQSVATKKQYVRTRHESPKRADDPDFDMGCMRMGIAESMS